MKLLLGDCLEQMKTLADNSVDSIVTDPPYGLSAAKNSGKKSSGGFMGKQWDHDVPSTEIWREALRVLKPGGHLLAFFGTRTYHRGVVRIEDAGFEIRDQLQWIYGTGFPKSFDISKAIYKAAGAVREIIGRSPNWRPSKTKGGAGFDKDVGEGTVEISITAPSTDEAKRWQGFGTSLKPANEPIVLARKPIVGTVAANVLKHGTGVLNIDASRIGENPLGRFPANVLFDEDAAAVLDEQSGHSSEKSRIMNRNGKRQSEGFPFNAKSQGVVHGDSGGASRFFYVAKTSKAERGAENNHPTVKPIKLMEYLVRLVTPPNGVVLDPFMGSGSTGVACRNLGFGFIGCEMNADYLAIAEKRISFGEVKVSA